MKNKTYSLLLSLIFFSTLIFIFSIDQASAHEAKKSKKHEPTICITESERTKQQKWKDKYWNNLHRLSKLQTDCLIVIKEKFGDELKELEDRLKGVGNCVDIPFNHKASTNSKIYIKANKDSNVIANVKKNQALLFYSVSTKNKKFSFVKIRKEGSCADGYIESKFLVKIQGEDIVVEVGRKLIEITDPPWAKDKDGKLILVDAEGFVSIIGAIQEGEIDQIIINDEEELINSDNTFSKSLLVQSGGAEVRIIGNKNGKKVKALIFKVRVGN